MKIKGVVRSAGNPVAEVRLTLLAGSDELAAGHSDSQGRFELQHDSIAPGDGSLFMLRLEKAGFRQVETWLDPAAEEDSGKLEFELERSEIEFKLVLKDQNRKPLEGVRVTVQFNGDPVGRGITDYTGLATLLLDPGLEHQKLFLKAERKGMETLSGDFELKRDLVLPLTMHSRSRRWAAGKWKKSGALLVLLLILFFLLIYNSLPENPVEVAVFQVDPPQTMQGESAVLKWATRNASSVTVNGADVALSGSMMVNPDRDTEYLLVAGNSQGEVERRVSLKVKLPPEVLQGLVRQFMKIYSELRDHPAGGERLDVEDPFNALVAASDSNTILSSDCRQDALDFAIDTLRLSQGLESTEVARRMAEEHIHHERQALRGGNFESIFKHLAECKDFCRPWISRVILCHVQAVAQHKPAIVLFATNSKRVAPAYADGLLTSIARQALQNPSRKVLLVGRASKLGPAGYNRRLSRERADSVREILMAKGVVESQLEVLPLGYEPPQISLEIARAYRFEELYLAQGDQFMNQSVVVAIF